MQVGDHHPVELGMPVGEVGESGGEGVEWILPTGGDVVEDPIRGEELVVGDLVALGVVAVQDQREENAAQAGPRHEDAGTGPVL